MTSPIKMLISGLGGDSSAHMHREELISATQAQQTAQTPPAQPSQIPTQQPPVAPPSTSPVGASAPGQPNFLATAAAAAPSARNVGTKTLLGQ